jgi:hypothetical protein
MANLPEVDQFDSGVYQLETTDPALAGANGIMNTPPKSLVNRTRYLLNRMLDGALRFITDSGTVNAIAVSFPQPIQALADGMEVSFRVANATTTASTLKLTNTGGPTLPILPLYGGDHNALPGGELPVGAIVRAKLNMSLNGGSGAWVTACITGGLARIPTPPSGDSSTLAANMAAVFNASKGMQTINVGVGADVTLTQAQYGVSIIKLTGTPTAPINLILPANTGEWVIWNQQGGTNNITVKPTGGTGVILPQNNSASIIVSDGSTAAFASAQAGQAFLTAVPITGVTGTTLTIAGGYTPGAIMLEKNGTLLEPAGSAPDYTATTSPTITLTRAAASADTFTLYKFTTFNVANAVQKSGDTMAGSLALYGGDTIATDPANGDNSTKLHSTKWVWNNILALVNSIIGSVTGVTPTKNDNSTKIPTTAWVLAQNSGIVGTVRNGKMAIGAASATGSWTADEFVVESALGGARYCIGSASGSVNLATTGAGGMDTGAAPVSGYVAIYGIYNPTANTFNLLATAAVSAVAPEVYGGGSMPTGYTASALICVWPTNASSQFVPGSLVDRKFYFAALPTALSTNTQATAPTSFSVSSIIPKNAKTCFGLMSLNSPAASVTSYLNLYGNSGSAGQKERAFYSSATNQLDIASFENLPVLVSQTLYYVLQASSGSAYGTVYISGYEI